MQFGTAGKATGKATHLFVKAECPKLFKVVQLAWLWLAQVQAKLQLSILYFRTTCRTKQRRAIKMWRSMLEQCLKISRHNR